MIPLQVDPLPNVRAGTSPGKEAWSSRSEGVAVEAEESPRIGRNRPCWVLPAMHGRYVQPQASLIM